MMERLTMSTTSCGIVVALPVVPAAVMLAAVGVKRTESELK